MGNLEDGRGADSDIGDVESEEEMDGFDVSLREMGKLKEEVKELKGKLAQARKELKDAKREVKRRERAVGRRENGVETSAKVADGKRKKAEAAMLRRENMLRVEKREIREWCAKERTRGE